MFSPDKFAVLIICYKPTIQDLLRIKKTISNFKKSIIVWNSKQVLDNTTPNLYQIELKENIGQAEALNIGFRKAISIGIELLLTLDQDSKIIANEKNIINKINHYFENYTHPAGFSFARFSNLKNKKNKNAKTYPNPYLTPITSGCVYLTSVWEKLNGFQSELFIEGIDTEFAIRAKRKNFNFYKFNYEIIFHDAGIITRRKFFNFRFIIRAHSDVRIYLQYRNNLPTFLKNFIFFPKWSLRSIFNLFTKKFLFSLFGSQNIIKTFLYIVWGVFDGILEITTFKKNLKPQKNIIKDYL